MDIENSLEEKIKRTDRRVQEILMQCQRDQEEFSQILLELGTSTQELQEHFSDPSHFSPSEWEEIEAEKNKWDEMLENELQQIRNPSEIEKKMGERRNIQEHWLFVR